MGQLDLTPRVTLEQQTYNLGKAFYMASAALKRDVPQGVIKTPSDNPLASIYMVRQAAVAAGVLSEEATAEIERLLSTVGEDYPHALPVYMHSDWYDGYYAARLGRTMSLSCRRLDLGYTPEQMAAKIGCMKSVLRMYEIGTATPGEVMLAKLSEAYEYPPEEVLLHTAVATGRYKLPEKK